MKKVAKLRDGPRRSARFLSPLIVSRLVGASPEKMLEMLTPLSASSPRPSVRRDWITAASFGRLATSIWPVSFSYQRKAGTSPLRPCSRPAWLAGVVAGSWACQPDIVWLPVRIHLLRVGRSPDRTHHWSTGSESPSIWTKTTPGTASTAAGPEVRGDPFRSWVRNAALSPAVANQLTMLISAANSHEAQ